MSILENLLEGLSKVKLSESGAGCFSMTINGHEYVAIRRRADSRFSCKSWGKVTFKKDGKIISKENLKKES